MPLSADQGNSRGLNMDVKRILYQVIRYWYLIVLSVLVALSVAFVVNRYSPKVFPVTASLIVKEAEDMSGADLIYNNPLVNFRRNYLNEIYIIKSFPLIQRVVEDLNLDLTFYKQGSILTTEAYDGLPIQASVLRDVSTRAAHFTFTAIDKNQYLLQTLDEDVTPESRTLNFNDTIEYGNFKGAIRVDDVAGLDGIIGQPLYFYYTPSHVVADRYANKLKAEWAEVGAGVVLLSLEGTSAKKEKSFLAGLIAEYQNNDLEHKNATASRTVEFISAQLEGITDSLRTVELELERFKSGTVVTDLNGEGLRLYEKAAELELQKSSLTINANYYKYLIDYINKNEDLHQIILPSSVGIADPILTNLVNQMTEIQMDIKMTTRTENPLVAEGYRKIAELKKNIIESVKNQQSTDKIKLDFINKQLSTVDAQLDKLPMAQRKFVSIQRNYTLLENLYIFLLQKRSEAAISKASTISDIVVVNHPKAGDAISPKPKRNYILALMVGIFIPFFGFVLVELFNTKVQSKEDIENITTIPFIGGVGHKSADSNLAVFQKPKSALAESFRALRSNLNYFVSHKQKAIFVITSSISGEGKTFTSINLAGVLSMSGKKTLIIGADLRKPKIFHDFNLSNEKGLSTYLAGLATFEEVTQSTSYENLNFVSGGPVPPNPSELLLSTRMQEFIERAKMLYDFIVIDTPPLAIVSDAFILSPYADHVLFLVRQNYTPKELLRAVEENFKAGKLKNISIVLNDIYKSGPGYGFGYGQGYGYGYGYNYTYGYTYGRSKKDSSGYYEND